MDPVHKIYQRKSIRLKGFDYSQDGGYFITAVSLHRDHLFGEVVGGKMRLNALGRIIWNCWDEIPIHFPNVELGLFVIMPNHVHGIIFIFNDNQGDASSRRGTICCAGLNASDSLSH
jgi:putative transposase